MNEKAIDPTKWYTARQVGDLGVLFGYKTGEVSNIFDSGLNGTKPKVFRRGNSGFRKIKGSDLIDFINKAQK